MFTTGSKFFFGFSLFAFLAALFYGGATAAHEVDMATLMGVITLGYKGSVGDHVGYTVLMSAAAASAFMGMVVVAFRDAEAEAATEVLALDAVPTALVPSGTSPWPVVGAFGAGSVAVGLVVGAPLVILGTTLLIIATLEWAVRNWADKATGDGDVNRVVRNRLMAPIEIPLFGVIGIGVFVLAVSRVLLALPKLGGYLVFGGVPALLLVLGFFFAARPKISRNALYGLMLFGGVAVIAAGVAGAAAGPREIEEHHTEHGDEEGAPAPVAPGDPVVVRGGS